MAEKSWQRASSLLIQLVQFEPNSLGSELQNLKPLDLPQKAVLHPSLQKEVSLPAQGYSNQFGQIESATSPRYSTAAVLDTFDGRLSLCRTNSVRQFSGLQSWPGGPQEGLLGIGFTRPEDALFDFLVFFGFLSDCPHRLRF